MLDAYLNPKELDFTTLAAFSATEIDRLYLGRADVDYSLISELASRVRKIISSREQPDTFGLIILWKAIKEHSDREIRYVDDLVMKISLLAQELESVKSLSKENLESLRGLCLDLSREARVYDDPIRYSLVA